MNYGQISTTGRPPVFLKRLVNEVSINKTIKTLRELDTIKVVAYT